MAAWEPKTFWSEILSLNGDAEAQAGLLDAYAVNPEEQLRDTMTVRAPCCGRPTAADDILDLRSVSGTPIRYTRGAKAGTQEDASWACSACWTWMVRDPGNGWTPSRLFRVLGAPPDVIRHERALELTNERVRAAHARGEAANRGEIMHAALGELPEGRRDLPGTEAPS